MRKSKDKPKKKYLEKCSRVVAFLVVRPARLWLCLCTAYAVLWLLHGAYGLACSRLMPLVELDAAALGVGGVAVEGMESPVPGQYKTTTGDPLLVIWPDALPGAPVPVRQVQMYATFSQHPHEMELFYSRKQGQGFSIRKRVVGAPQDDGSYLYTLLPGRVRSLRIDLGSIVGNDVAISRLVLNPRLPALRYFTPTLRTFAGLAVLPALACCCIYTIIELFEASRRLRAKRRQAAQ